MIKERYTYSIVALMGVIIGSVMVFLSACRSNKEVQGEWVYVPEFISLDKESFPSENAQVSGESIYFLSQDICRYSVVDKQFVDVHLNWQCERTERVIKSFFAAHDGSIYLIANEDGGRQILYKFDYQGNQILSQDVTNQTGNALTSIAVDAKGRIYLGNEARVWLYDEIGCEQGYIVLGNTDIVIAKVGCDSKGNVYAVYYENNAQGFWDLGNFNLAELDFDDRKVHISYSGLSLGNANDLTSGIDNFWGFDDVGVYEYNVGSQEKKVVFEWLECSIDGAFVDSIGILSDGRVIVMYDNWLNDDRGIVLLTKTEKSQITQKETIVVATMYYNRELYEAALNFNRNSEKYKVVIQQYVEDDSSGTDTLPDAIKKLNNDIVSSDCPDIIDLSELNIDQLVAADVLEDIAPYLENSNVLSQTDFLENVLDNYTINDSLVTIPYKITIYAVFGSSEKLGNRSGWTIDEITDFANAFPESELFGKIEKYKILQYLMMLNGGAFFDMQTGKCNFDSEQFKELLQFVYDLPGVTKQNQSAFLGPAMDVDEQDEKTLPNPVRIQKGEVLLDIEYIFNFDTIQMCKEMFQGDVVCIGFPTLDGTGGYAFCPLQTYGITTKSGCKEGAWKFMESLLLQEESGYGNEYGFPTRKVELEAMINRTLNYGYLLDEFGELLLDEEGKPVDNPEQLPTSISNDGWSYTCRRTTQDEIEIMLAVLTNAKRISSSSNAILQIISEEADAYFTDQKNLNDVVNIIQNRVGIYVEENR